MIAMPQGLTCRQAMEIGTAGYTAMLCVMALQKHGAEPKDDVILVSIVNGGVGNIAITLLARLYYAVAASTGRTVEADY
jgi:acrylyl-CoA reductase (NADPH)